MMQMLQQGGVEAVTDHIRAADIDNPRGYFELERVKKIKQDASWLPQTRGKAFKIVSQLLYDLPPGELYRIIFMERNLDEMLLSQTKMLERLGRTIPPQEDMKRAFTLHLQKLRQWLERRPSMRTLYVPYHDLVQRPEEQVKRVSEFLGGKLDIERMVKTVDTSLYRNRYPTLS
jgi:hypothetical protein